MIAGDVSPRASGFVPDWLTGFAGMAFAVAGYRVLYSAAHLLAGLPLGMDDVSDNVWVQQLALTYGRRQPPLYDWLLWGLQRPLGAGELSLAVLKTLLLTLTAVFLLGAARAAIRDRRIAAIAVLSYALYYNVAWTLLDRLPQTAALLCACAASAWTLARTLRSGRRLDYALFGLALGAGFLAKFNFGLFAIGLLVGALSEPAVRRRLSPGGLLIALAALLLALAPFAWGVVVASPTLPGYLANSVMREGSRAPYLARVALGLANFALAAAEYALPLIPLALAVFWKPLATGQLERTDDHDAFARVLGKSSLVAGAAALIGVVATGSLYVRDWHMAPVFFGAPIWLFARIARGGPKRATLRLWTALIAIAVVGCAGVRLVGAFMPSIGCNRHCMSAAGYAALARRVGPARSALYVFDVYDAGNLRPYLPAAHIEAPGVGWPATSPAARCFAVWNAAGPAAPRPPPGGAWLPTGSMAPTGPDQAAPYTSPNGKPGAWGLRPLPPSSPLCR
ncbi:MAG TPA: glycosyltransferase family 39 protein [Caulobacteraceae bacterium]|nr:glycosyltransferase family 39 protein [Caulobacteraceae bacterium]